MAKHPSQIMKRTIRDIDNTLAELWNNKLLRDSNCPSCQLKGKNDYVISYNTKNDSSSIIYDTNVSYDYLIDTLLLNRQYSLLFYDKSIIQAEFLIENDAIVKERLVFIKKHTKVWNIDEIDELEGYEIDWFTENTGIPTFLRIDYDPEAFKEIRHPKTHFTISNQDNCRIPIKGIVTFSEFVKFVVSQIYDIELNIPSYRHDDETITSLEKKNLHFNWT